VASARARTVESLGGLCNVCNTQVTGEHEQQERQVYPGHGYPVGVFSRGGRGIRAKNFDSGKDSIESVLANVAPSTIAGRKNLRGGK
jgi:hypothetical protein